MSTTIDERVVAMEFDNQQFEQNVQTSIKTLDNLKDALNFEGMSKGLQDLDRAAQEFDLTPIRESVGTIEVQFSAMSIAAIAAIQNIVNAAMNAGERIVKSLTIDQVTAGFQKYTDKTQAVQTIMNATGLSVEQVGDALEKLSWFTDETSFSFTNMVDSIGKFTSNAVDLDVAISAMEGIANVTALAGQNYDAANRAMYNFAQAISIGSVKLMDWRSIQNANLATSQFKEVIIDTAVELGTLIKTTDGFKTAAKGTEVSVINFENALSEGWFTSEVLLETLGKFSAFTDAVYEIADGYDTCAEAMEHVSEEGMEISAAAFRAAQQAKTFQEAIDATKDAVSSGWMRTFEIMFGNYEESVELWTALTNELWDIFASGAEARNELLAEGLSTTGWSNYIDDWILDASNYEKKIIEVGKTQGVITDEMIDQAGGFAASLKDGWASADILYSALSQLVAETMNLSDAELEARGYTRQVARSYYDLWKAINSGEVLLSDMAEQFEMTGRENAIQGIANIYHGLLSIIEPLKDAFNELFPAMTGEQLYALTESFKNFTAQLTLSEEAQHTLYNGAKLLLTPIRVIFDALKFGFGVIADGLLFIWKLIDGFLALGESTEPLKDALKGVFGNELFTEMAKAAYDAVEALITICKRFGDGLKEVLVDAGLLRTEMIDGVAAQIGKVSGPLDLFARIITAVINLLASALNASAPIFESFGKLIGRIGSIVVQAIKDLSLDDLIRVLSGAAMSNAFMAISNFFSKLRLGVTRGTGILNNFRDASLELVYTLEYMRLSIGAKAMLEIAFAIGILSASLALLSSIDADGLMFATGAIAVMFKELSQALITFSVLGLDKHFSTIAKLVILMGALTTSVLVLSAAVKVLGSLDLEGLIGGLVGVMALMRIMVKTMSSLTSIEGEVIKAGGAMMGFAIALRVLASSVKVLGQLSFGEILKGLMGVYALGAGLLLFLKSANFETLSLNKGLGLVALAASVRVLASAVEAFSKLNFEEMLKGLAGVGVILAELSLFMNATNSATGTLKTSIGLTVLAASMLIFAEAVSRFGSIPFLDLMKGLYGMGIALAEVGIAITLIPKNAIAIGAGLVVVATSMLILAQAMTQIGELSWEQLCKGLLAIAGALGLFAIAVNAMSGAMAGAAAILVVAGALAILTPSLLTLANLSLGQIIGGLVMLGGSFAIFAAAAIALAPTVPIMLGLGAAIGLLGVGVFALGAGILSISAGLAGFVVSADAAVIALIDIFANLLKTIPDFFIGLVDAITGLLVSINEMIPPLVETFVLLGQGIIDIFYELGPPLIDVLLYLIDELVIKVNEYLPIFFDECIKFIDIFLLGLVDAADEIVIIGVQVIVAFVDALISQTGVLIDAAIDLMIALMDGLGIGIEQRSPELVAKLFELGEHLIQGIIDGLWAAAVHLGDALIELATGAINTVKSALGIHSPSRVTKEEIGEPIAEGIAEGIEENDAPEKAAEEKAKKIYSSFKEAVEELQKEADQAGENYRLWDQLNPNAKDAERAGQQMKVLMAELRLQEAKVNLANEQYQETLNKLGSESQQTQEAYNNYLQEQINLNALTETVTEARQTQAQLNNEAAVKYAKLMSESKDDLLKIGYTEEEIEAWARKQSGIDKIDAYVNGAQAVANASQTYAEATASSLAEGLNAVQNVVETGTVAAIQNGTARAVENSTAELKKSAVAMTNTLSEGITEAAPEVSNAVADTLIQSFSNPDAYSTLGTNVAENVAESVKSNLSSMKESGNTLYSSLQTGLEEAAQVTQDGSSSRTQIVGTAMVNGLNQGLSEETPAFQEQINEVIDAGQDQFTDREREWYDIGQACMDGLIAGLESKKAELQRVCEELAQMAASAMASALQVHSPSRLTMAIGEHTGEGLAIGISNMAGLVARDSEALAETSVDAMSKAIDRIASLVDMDVDLNPTITPVLDLDDFKKDAGEIGNVLGGTNGLQFGGTISRATSTASRMAKDTDSSDGRGQRGNVTNNYNFTQNNSSPKALSRIEIYRQTRNQFAQLKEVKTNNA